MKIYKLKIRNFRNIARMDLEPYNGLNIFTGENGQGKTNLLESIFVLATGSSFRRSTDTNLAKYDCGSYYLEAEYGIFDRRIDTVLQYSINGSKLFQVNQKKSNHNNQDRIRVVIFTPDDLFLIKGSPSKRRAFLDFCLKQVSNEYIYNLENYYNTLSKRNIFLKREQTAGRSFKIINDLFVENAVRLIIQRINFIGLLEEISRSIFGMINDSQKEMRIKYALSFAIENDKINMEILQTAMHKHIYENLNEETQRRRTMVGPHLDDLNVYYEGRAAQIFASQGQQRNLSISLKLAELYAFQRVKGYYPVLLLDDVFSELDGNKRTKLVKYLREADFQTFLTTVSMDAHDDYGCSHYRVEGGRLERKEN